MTVTVVVGNPKPASRTLDDEARRLLEQAHIRLQKGGRLLLEIEERQGEAVRQLAGQAWPGSQAIIYPDLEGRDRLAVVTGPD